MAKQQAKSGDNVTRWIVIAMVSLVVVTGVVFSIFSQNNKETESLAGLDGFKAKAALHRPLIRRMGLQLPSILA